MAAGEGRGICGEIALNCRDAVIALVGKKHVTQGPK